MKNIAIIGGGPAGLVAAIVAARAGAQVTVYEAADRVGKTLLATGNGRCNFSNAALDGARYHNADFVAQTFAALPPQDVLTFFKQLGLFWIEEGEGRLYPRTLKASSVLDVLRLAARDAGVQEICGDAVARVTPLSGGMMVLFPDSETLLCDAVVVACGGRGARSLLPARYAYQETLPVLGPLQTETEAIKGLNNIRVRAAISCENEREEGEILFRDYGVSGIAVFNLSRVARAGSLLTIDFMPEFSAEQLGRVLAAQAALLPQRTALEFCAGFLQAPVARAVLRRAGVAATTPLDAAGISLLVGALKHFELRVCGQGDPKQCQVQRGGFAPESFNAHTLESKTNPGLFVVGEALDIDGPCGGYNLHWAWTSGILAGRAAAGA
ncbi:MAG: aminoacetone oxidase family FAD-binding enzyme [Raoultibacter sp.]